MEKKREDKEYDGNIVNLCIGTLVQGFGKVHVVCSAVMLTLFSFLNILTLKRPQRFF